jgi:tetratricopeptide (TPR) repeat protein
MKRFSRSALVGLAALALSPTATAEPTFWQRVANRRATVEAKLLASVERTLDAGWRANLEEFGLDREFARAAVVMVELKGITEPSDPGLACVFAQALVEADIGREADARRLLERSIAKLPPGTRAATAWNALAVALGRLDDPKAEYRAYTRVIELTWDADIRAVSYFHRGNVAMRERDLAGAKADYEQAVIGAREPSLVARARYGLAVAEERLGDLPQAYAALDRALVVKLPVPPFPVDDPLDLPTTIFVPSYEESYVRALRAMAIGRRTTDQRERNDAFETAVAEWDIYLARSPEDEPFRENARAHRARADREIERPPAPRRR